MNLPMVNSLLAAFPTHQQVVSLAWLQEEKLLAFQKFQNQPLPTRRSEHWKYTDISAITKVPFTLANVADPIPPMAAFNQFRLENADYHELVFINGQYCAEYSNTIGMPTDIIASSLQKTLSEKPQLLEGQLNSCVEGDQHVFATLNTAFFSDGALLYLPDNLVLSKPISLLFISANANGSVNISPRNLIIVGKHVKATIIERYFSLDDAANLTNTITEIIMDDGATIEHYKVQQENIYSFHIGGTHVRQQRNSRLQSHFISLGGALTRNDIVSHLNAENAEIVLNGLYVGRGNQHIDTQTLVNHAQPYTTSKEDYRGVLSDRAKGIFNGRVIVHKDAQKIDAAQSNANLLLSDHAEANSKPSLEIYADDVKCSHGSTVGQLDENMLFYLRARGLDEDTAKNLLIYAFTREIINRISFAPLRNMMEYAVLGHLPDSELLQEFV